jgi:ABC-type glycerol-3-phosphate transport system permease component
VRLGFGLASLGVAAAALLALMPFAWMLLTSVKPADEIFVFPARLFPSRFDLSTYGAAFSRLPLLRYLWNSTLVCAGVVSGQLAVSALAAYALARLKPRFAGIWALAIGATMMIPLESLVVPLYLQMRAFPTGEAGWGVNLLNTRVALILPGLVSAFNVFVLRGFFSRLPEEILSSARIDGCSEWGTFFRFVVPLTRPILTVLALFAFIATWNAFFWPLVALTDPSSYTLMLGVQKMMETGEPWNLVMAAVTLATLPSILLFLLASRWLNRGLAFSFLYQ